LLRAMVSCGSCRLACQARRAMPSHKTYYICTGKAVRARQRLGGACSSMFIPADVLDELVWADLVALLQHPDRVAKALRSAAGGWGGAQEPQARRENPRGGGSSLGQPSEGPNGASLSGGLPVGGVHRPRAG